MAPANLRACYHLKGEMLDKPSAFPTRLWAESAPLAVPELLLGRRWKEASKGRGGKLRNESGNAFHKQQDSWNGSRGPDLKFFLRSCSRVLWIGKGWGNMQLPSAIPHVLCFCHRVPECAGGRWECELWCWVGACSKLTQTQIIKFCGSITERKYFSLCSLKKQENTFSRKKR